MSGHDARHPSGPDPDGRGARGLPRVNRQRSAGRHGSSGAGRSEPPADLGRFAELQATDSLLDRLARRDPTEDDLADPLAGLLHELARDADLETDSSRRFRAVLAGRTAQDGQWRIEPPTTGSLPEVPVRAAAHRRILDHPRGFLRQVVRALPATGAAAAVLLAVAGGVVAAVAGDPMAPIDGLNKALSAPETVSFTSVQETIARAANAAGSGQRAKARTLIASARKDLPKVPAPDASQLDRQIDKVEAQLGATPTASEGSPTADPTLAPTADPTGGPTGSGTESPTATGTPAPTETGTPDPTQTATTDPTTTPTTAPTSTQGTS